MKDGNGESNLEIVKVYDNYIHLRISGDLDFLSGKTSSEFHKRVSGVKQQVVGKDVLIDISKMGGLDSSGLAELVYLLKNNESGGKRLLFCGDYSKLKHLVDINGLNGRINIEFYDSIDEVKRVFQ